MTNFDRIERDLYGLKHFWLLKNQTNTVKVDWTTEQYFFQ